MPPTTVVALLISKSGKEQLYWTQTLAVTSKCKHDKVNNVFISHDIVCSQCNITVMNFFTVFMCININGCLPCIAHLEYPTLKASHSNKLRHICTCSKIINTCKLTRQYRRGPLRYYCSGSELRNTFLC